MTTCMHQGSLTPCERGSGKHGMDEGSTESAVNTAVLRRPGNPRSIGATERLRKAVVQGCVRHVGEI
jgi:hypothetical protein